MTAEHDTVPFIVARHPWVCGALAEIVAGPHRGLVGVVRLIYRQDGETMLDLVIQGGKEVCDVPATMCIPI